MNKNYAVRKLADELEDQLLIQKSFESKPATEKIKEITDRRVQELEEALKILEPVTA